MQSKTIFVAKQNDSLRKNAIEQLKNVYFKYPWPLISSSINVGFHDGR